MTGWLEGWMDGFLVLEKRGCCVGGLGWCAGGMGVADKVGKKLIFNTDPVCEEELFSFLPGRAD
jgi:hypothetical protein